MSIDLTSAARTLEDAFFAKENARLLEQMRTKARQDERRQALRDVIQIHDDALVDHLLELGLGAEAVLALTLVPLARVAWADGAIQPKERDAILKAAAEQNIAPGSVAHQMLENWLSREPDFRLIEAWRRVTETLWPSLSVEERAELRTSSLERARHVAEAAGGFLGLTSGISGRERVVLDEIGELLAG
jgi:hypothetical protein